MLLTEIKIKGFKSFAKKVTINFDKGITGIVGPNGCGKSNIVDAIRWVLGEQRSKTLRSEKMENIIFNGTKNRNATQLAEVTLSFENTKHILPTEYNTISVSRRYYRSGDSEYLLNGVACRLKDITSLFLDTGISSNSYAIIELKMIDEILGDKDGARRALFEEVASISKFKNRKKKSLKQLEGTSDDLVRLDDLLYEIEKNLKSLEQQARKADKYQKIKNDYKNLSIVFAQKSTRNLENKRKTILNDIQKNEVQKTEFIKTVNTFETQIEIFKKELLKKEALLKTRQKALTEHINKIRQFENNKKIKSERLKHFNEKAHTLHQQIDNDKKSKERAVFSIKSLINEKSNVEKAFQLIQTEFEQTKHKRNKLTQLLTEKLEKQQLLTIEVQQIQKDNYEIEKQIEINQIQLKTFEKELQSASLDTTEKIESLALFENKSKELENLLAQNQKELKELKRKQEKILTKTENFQDVIQNIQEELEIKNREIDAKQNEYNLTQSMVNSLEGYPEAIKYLTKKTKWGSEKPLLSDILICKAKYRTAIENFLKPYINYYVVDTYKDALDAINILSDAGKGKANFFCLENFTNIKLSPISLNISAIAATEVINYDKKFSKLIAFLLHNVFIVDEIPDNLISNEKIVLLTENGNILKNYYSLNGGSVGLFEGRRIGRVKNLAILKKEINKRQSEIDILKVILFEKEEELKKIKNSSLITSINSKIEEITQINQKYITFKTKFEQVEQLINSQKNKKINAKETIKEIKQELKHLTPKCDEIIELLENKEKKQKSHQKELNADNQTFQEIAKLYNQKQIQKIQTENEINQLNQNIDNKEKILETTVSQINKNSAEEKSNNEAIKQLLLSSEDNENDLLNMYHDKEIIEEEVQESEKDYYTSRGKIDKLQDDAKITQKKMSDLDEINALYKEKKNEIDLAMTALTERLSAEFGIDLSTNKRQTDVLKKRHTTVSEDNLVDVLDYVEDKEVIMDLSEEMLSEKIKNCKLKMEKMGEINPMAKTTYDEIKERFEFVTLQKEDLLKAKRTLLETIEEIEKYATENFLETFEKIKVNFVKVFRSLFSENDDCSLELIDPNKPLESAIDIIAKPKGKKPLSINQLSGGEKSLTAIALLFSLYLLKPAPFCIFDEVDAPLDDANIDKFNQIIKKFSKDSQFIIVTHNKRTMTTTDVIYGVTMIEQGISQVVPVNFSNIK